MTTANALLVVGGGRWARVYLSILARLECAFDTVFVVSEHGGDLLAAALEQANALQRRRFLRLDDWREAGAAGAAGAAIVINAARDHAATSMALLDASIPVLVEKPAAMNPQEAGVLTARARAGNRLLKPALMLNYCEYLKVFARAAHAAIGPPASIEIHWKDAAYEARYGESKTIDMGLGLAEDVGPHIATILALLAGDAEVETVTIARGGLAVTLQGRCGGAALSVFLERDAIVRQRLVVLQGAKGKQARLDFTIEPGTMEMEGSRRSADPGWSGHATPLTLQLLDFLRLADGPALESDLAAILQTAIFSATAASKQRAAQRTWLVGPGSGAAGLEKLVALRELLAPYLIEAGLAAAGDNAGLEALTQTALAGAAKGRLAQCLRVAGINPEIRDETPKSHTPDSSSRH